MRHSCKGTLGNGTFKTVVFSKDEALAIADPEYAKVYEEKKKKKESEEAKRIAEVKKKPRKAGKDEVLDQIIFSNCTGGTPNIDPEEIYTIDLKKKILKATSTETTWIFSIQKKYDDIIIASKLLDILEGTDELTELMKRSLSQRFTFELSKQTLSAAILIKDTAPKEFRKDFKKQFKKELNPILVLGFIKLSSISFFEANSRVSEFFFEKS